MISHCYCSQREGQKSSLKKGRVIEIMNEEEEVVLVGVANGIYVINKIILIKYFILINFQIKSKENVPKILQKNKNFFFV